MTTTDEIAARNAARTQGEWKRDPYDRPDMQVIAAGNEVIIYHHHHPRQVDSRVVPNAAFIANAPADQTYLLERVRTLEGALRAVKDDPKMELDSETYNRMCDALEDKR